MLSSETASYCLHYRKQAVSQLRGVRLMELVDVGPCTNSSVPGTWREVSESSDGSSRMKTAATPRVMAYRDGQTTHALLLGAVNRESAPLYRRRLAPYTEQGCRAVALDLGEAEYIDSDG